MGDYIVNLKDVAMGDVTQVGGKNASLGEMINHLSGIDVDVPGGFATTADAYRAFLSHAGLPQRISAALNELDVDDVSELARTGENIRRWVVASELPSGLHDAIVRAYTEMQAEAGGSASVAVRSSATAEDLPEASFAGQQETYLNVSSLENLLHTVKKVFASLYNDRAIAYRVHHGFNHADVILSAGVQRMVRSDVGSAGVMFTLDTESRLRDVVLITASYGLGEAVVVQGSVNPDEFYVHKPTLAAGRPAVLQRNLGSKANKLVYSGDTDPEKLLKWVDVAEAERERFCLTDFELLELARQAVAIERHYGWPMEIEWAKDGTDGKLYILQARPETVQSRGSQILERFAEPGYGGRDVHVYGGIVRRRVNRVTLGRFMGILRASNCGTLLPLSGENAWSVAIVLVPCISKRVCSRSLRVFDRAWSKQNSRVCGH